MKMRPQRPTARAVSIAASAMLILFFGLAPAAAQLAPGAVQGSASAPVETPDWSKLGNQERRDLLSRLSDEQVREIMVGQLQRAEPAARGASDEGSMITGFQDRVHLIRERVGVLMGEVKNIPTAFVFAHGRLSEGRSPWLPLRVVAGMVLMFLVGAVLEWLFRRWTKAARLRFEQAPAHTLCGQLGFMSLRLALDVAALAIFTVGFMATFFMFYQGFEPIRNFVMTYLSVVLIVRAVSMASRLVIAPGTPEARLIPFDDAEARYYHNCILWFTGVLTFGFMTCALMLILGLSEDTHMLMRTMVGLIVTAMLCMMIWHGRHGIAKLIRAAEDASPVERRVRDVLADIWHFGAIAYVLAVVALTLVRRLSGEDTSTGATLGSMLILVAVPLLDAAVGRLLTDFANRTRGAHPDTEPGTTYLPVIRRGARILLVLLGVFVFARLWGVNLFSMADQSFGVAVTRTILDVGFTVFIAYVGWQIAKTAIDKHLAAEGGEAEVERGAEGGGTGASRMRTLLPLLRRFLQITIAVMVTMIVLSSLGVDIGPLIAGAGVVGLAIGFGAQTLVRDIVSGIFFLVDDAFRAGEYIDIGDVKGTVEKITMRSLVLRHHRGPLHTVPFGEIKYLSNYSRDWVIMKLAFRVTYDTDINKVKKIFKKIGAELMEDELLGPGFIEPFKSQGVQSMEDSAIIVRGKFMAKPGQQFMIRKEVYRRVQEAFKEAGIEFAHRRVAVDLPPGIEPGSEQATKIGEAAAAALEQEAQASPA
jgi:small-conductance mechanosensitive channel